ncbi:J domain-containing protein [Dermatobacter hominis]|uniref:J domain-containing protein n=1 Tax=Dermatobacter hominis TaxID=2884263 RepID=UPI001D11CE0A|nr:J domain-containing protein [Dermatobacter hominis]UDY36079.1 J domain-containing protein [Dermatobacter hominis]
MWGVVDRTHYQVLGVRPSAPTPEIRRAYRALAYRLHPDRQAGTTPAEQRLAERRMREVNAAWTTLSDPLKRADYDRSLARTSSATSSAGSTSTATTTAASPAPSGEWWDSDDPDAALARARSSQLDPDEPELSGAQFWLLRRGPIVIMVIVGLVIFVASAYAGRGATDPTATSAPPAVVAESNCVKLMPNNMAYTVSCEGGFDARIVREEPDVRACMDEGLGYAVVGSRSVCLDEE